MVRTITIHEPVLKLGLQLGEGPIYEPSTDTVHFVDITGLKVLHYTVGTGDLIVDDVDEPVGCLVLRKGGGLSCAAKSGFAHLLPTPSTPNHLTIFYLSTPLAPSLAPYTRFNDGACDPQGRFFAGTLLGRGMEGSPGAGELWCLPLEGENGGKATLVEGGWTDSNGMAWWKEDDGSWTYYFTDSGRNNIHAYTYEPSTGSVSNKRTFIDAVELGLADDGSSCDGLCIDTAGHIWSARWKGSKVTRFSRDGKAVDLVLEVPGAYYVTMPCFVGKKLDKLFITSASNLPSNGSPEPQKEKYPFQGDCFLYDFKGEFTGGEYRWEFTR